jgi:hypothetical protein
MGMKAGDCSNPDRETHRLNLMALKAFYEQWHPGCKVIMEAVLRAPGDPPRAYSPDLSVVGSDGTRLVAVEYQRSREAYEKFADRDGLRLKEGWASVDWWLDDTQNDPDKPVRSVYDQSDMHRTHLAAMGRPIYRCWVDPFTFVMQYDYGCSGALPPSRRKRVEKHIERAELKDCSIAQAIRDLEGEPEEQLIKEIKHPLRARPEAGVQGPGLAGVHPGLDLKYHLERERRVAEAVVARRSRLDEQDRRHREFGHKCRLVEEICELTDSTVILGDRGCSEANNQWTVQSLEQERDRLLALMPEALAVQTQRRQEELRIEEEKLGLELKQQLEEETRRLRDDLLATGEHDAEQLATASLWVLRLLTRQAEEAKEQEALRVLAEEAERRKVEAAAIAEARQLEQQQVRKEQARQWQLAEERHMAEIRLRQEREAEEAKRLWDMRWGVPVGSTGATVLWMRGISFAGRITHWTHDRPVIEGHAGKKRQLRWAFNPDDYSLMGGQH